MHWKEIVFTVFLFVSFELLAFLVQGKLPFYKVGKCDLLFALGICVLVAVTIVYLLLLFARMKRTFARFAKHGLEQEISLDRSRDFWRVAMGALTAGLIQGMLGMGCGTCIMMVLLAYPIASTAASATSGYQILFTGSASLLEYYLNGEVQLF